MAKRSYHSDFILQYKLGLLPPEIIKTIPSSTRSYWNKNDYSKLVGHEYMMLEKEENLEIIKKLFMNRKLKAAAKAMVFTFNIYSEIMEKVHNRNNKLKQHRLRVIQAIDRTQGVLGFKRTLRLWGISKNQFYAWKNVKRCSESVFDLCIKKFPHQLTIKEVNVIRKYLTAPKYRQWSNSAIYYQILRNKAAFLSKSTFYRYTHRLNLIKPRIRKPKYPDGLRAGAPKKILHMDVTIFKPRDNSRVYLYVLMDNYSRYIFNITASLEYSADICFQNIREAYDQYKLKEVLPPIELICDGGPENMGKVDDFVKDNREQIIKQIAQKHIHFSNSMVEAANKRIKHDFLFHTKPYNFEQTVKCLPDMKKQLNNRPLTPLHGFTPEEVVNGIIPNKNTYKTAIATSRAKRPAGNKADGCSKCKT